MFLHNAHKRTKQSRPTPTSLSVSIRRRHVTAAKWTKTKKQHTKQIKQQEQYNATVEQANSRRTSPTSSLSHTTTYPNSALNNSAFTNSHPRHQSTYASNHLTASPTMSSSLQSTSSRLIGGYLFQSGSDTDFETALDLYQHGPYNLDLTRDYTRYSVWGGASSGQNDHNSQLDSCYSTNITGVSSSRPPISSQTVHFPSKKPPPVITMTTPSPFSPHAGKQPSITTHPSQTMPPPVHNDQQSSIDWNHDFHANTSPMYLTSLINTTQSRPMSTARPITNSEFISFTSSSPSSSPPQTPESIITALYSFQLLHLLAPRDDFSTTNLTPQQIVSHFDRFIIGQNEAKRTVAISLRNRYRSLKLSPAQRQHILPKNILLQGPTGSGKSQLAKIVGKMSNSPLLHANMTEFTEAGFVGKSVDSLINDVVQAAIRILCDGQGEKVQREAEDNADWALAVKLPLNIPDLHWIMSQIDRYRRLMEPTLIHGDETLVGGMIRRTANIEQNSQDNGKNYYSSGSGNGGNLENVHHLVAHIPPNSIISSSQQTHLSSQLQLPPFILSVPAPGESVSSNPSQKETPDTSISSQPNQNPSQISQISSPSPTSEKKYAYIGGYPVNIANQRNNKTQNDDLQHQSLSPVISSSEIKPDQNKTNVPSNNSFTQAFSASLSRPLPTTIRTTTPTYFHIGHNNDNNSPTGAGSERDSTGATPNLASNHTFLSQTGNNNFLSVPVDLSNKHKKQHNDDNITIIMSNFHLNNHNINNNNINSSNQANTNTIGYKRDRDIQDLFTLVQLDHHQPGHNQQQGLNNVHSPTVDSKINNTSSTTSSQSSPQSLQPPQTIPTPDQMLQQHIANLSKPSNNPQPHYLTDLISSEVRNSLLQLHIPSSPYHLHNKNDLKESANGSPPLKSQSDSNYTAYSYENDLDVIKSQSRLIEPPPITLDETKQNVFLTWCKHFLSKGIFDNHIVSLTLPIYAMSRDAQGLLSQIDLGRGGGIDDHLLKVGGCIDKNLSGDDNNITQKTIHHFDQSSRLDETTKGTTNTIRTPTMVSQQDINQHLINEPQPHNLNGSDPKPLKYHPQRQQPGSDSILSTEFDSVKDRIKTVDQIDDIMIQNSGNIMSKTVPMTIANARKLFSLMEFERVSIKTSRYNVFGSKNTQSMSNWSSSSGQSGQNQQNQQNGQSYPPELIQSAIALAEKSGIIVLDEIDKLITAPGNMRSGGEASGVGVAKDLLPLLGGSIITTSYGPVDTTNMLFIGAGAFSDVSPSAMLPELSGRLPLKVELKGLGVVDYWAILTHTENSLLRQSVQLLAQEGVGLRFTSESVWAMAELAHVMNQGQNVGARRLNSIVEGVLEDVNFYLSNLDTIGTIVVVDGDYVRRKGSALAAAETGKHGQYVL